MSSYYGSSEYYKTQIEKATMHTKLVRLGISMMSKDASMTPEEFGMMSSIGADVARDVEYFKKAYAEALKKEQEGGTEDVGEDNQAAG